MRKKKNNKPQFGYCFDTLPGEFFILPTIVVSVDADYIYINFQWIVFLFGIAIKVGKDD